MSSKKTVSVKKKAPVKKVAVKKAAPKAKADQKDAAPVGPRHPRARVAALNGNKAEGAKEALAKTLAESLARADEDTAQIATRLKTASNKQLLRLQNAVKLFKSKYGTRDKLVATVAGKQSKDKDYVAKLEKLSLPNLLDLAKNASA
ncbi:MAG TPA: hypothetical protein VGC41_07790 [Kofleriaceae bacterium]